MICDYMGNMERKKQQVVHRQIYTVTQVVDKIKSLTFMSLKVKFNTPPFNFHGWWLSPFTMLGIG